MAIQELLVIGSTGLLKNLGSVVAQQIGMAWGVKKELKKLKDTLELIEAITYDAEKNQSNEKAVTLWLKRLKDVVYDADDVLDEFAYEAIRRFEMGGNRRKVREFFSSFNSLAFRLKMAHRIKGIIGSLNEISSNMAKFQFQNTTSESSLKITTLCNKTYKFHPLKTNQML